MNKFKLILTICLVAVLTLTMGVATFASDPLTEGGEILVRIKNTDIIPSDFYGTLSTNDYLVVEYYLNGIGYKPVFTDVTAYDGSFVNIYNVNDVLWTGDLTMYYDDITFDYIVMPEWIAQELINEIGLGFEYTRLVENNSILGVFSAVPAFIVNAVNSATGIFWANGALTMLGILAIIAVAFGVCLLMVSLITRFMGFRG